MRLTETSSTKNSARVESCEKCKCRVIADTCWCGLPLSDHKLTVVNHVFVPYGCRCHEYVVPDVTIKKFTILCTILLLILVLLLVTKRS